MPSSVIIVALAAAWLVVLVPMVARKRQQIARTADSALAARVVRSGDSRNDGREEADMPDDRTPSVEDDLETLEDEVNEDLEEEGPDEPLPQPGRPMTARDGERRYRPGRGGFDPEAAEMTARAKYAYRQRVVVGLLIVAVVAALVAGFLWSLVWYAQGAVDAILVAYLVYLRRQVRIEEDIRQRRLARLNSGHPRASYPVVRPPVEERDHGRDREHEYGTEVRPAAPRRESVERKPSPMSRVHQQAVVVDLDDEDPVFHELDEPGPPAYRRAAGE